ncbi:unnamed protein product [Arctogadus glacialis]
MLASLMAEVAVTVDDTAGSASLLSDWLTGAGDPGECSERHKGNTKFGCILHSVWKACSVFWPVIRWSRRNADDPRDPSQSKACRGLAERSRDGKQEMESREGNTHADIGGGRYQGTETLPVQKRTEWTKPSEIEDLHLSALPSVYPVSPLRPSAPSFLMWMSDSPANPSPPPPAPRGRDQNGTGSVWLTAVPLLLAQGDPSAGSPHRASEEQMEPSPDRGERR